MPKNYYIIPVFVPHLGCSHRCVFCRQGTITGQAGVPTGKEVAYKIDKYLGTIPERNAVDSTVRIEVAFYGGSFTCVQPELQRELLEPALETLRKGELHGIRVSTRPDAIDAPKLALLHEFGVDTVELGVQSTDEEVLALAERGHSSADVFGGARAVKDAGFRLGLQMMVGLPGDNREKTLRTAWDLVSLKPAFVRVYPVVVLRGTPLERKMREGSYKPPVLEEILDTLGDVKLVFNRAGIPVIRMGLQASEEIGWEGEVLAGAWHPALGELIGSRLALRKIQFLLEKASNSGLLNFEAPATGTNKAKKVLLIINPADESITRGHGRENIEVLHNMGINDVQLVTDRDIPRGTIVLDEVNGVRIGVKADNNCLEINSNKSCTV